MENCESQPIVREAVAPDNSACNLVPRPTVTLQVILQV